jgi:hypothetical protein
MKRKAFMLVLIAALALPSVSSAAGLTSAQVSAIVGLLQAFGVDQATVAHVEQILGSDPSASSSGGSVLGTSTSTVPVVPHVPVVGSFYPTSAVGYDLSFNSTTFPTIPFGFGVVGATSGRAYTHNAKFSFEYNWAGLASAAGPTIYLNLNAPYGSTVAGHTKTPKDCTNAAPAVSADSFPQTEASRGTNAYPEPSTCEAYNYGYNVAMDAYTYVHGENASAVGRFWWLDIEEANSWSANPAVNDATIQGALDYLNSKGLKAGIYSVPYMWIEIAGAGFTPTETINGSAFSVPTWFPIGIDTQVGALNDCNTKASFIPGSPIWILQYEDTATSVDRNVAC